MRNACAFKVLLAGSSGGGKSAMVKRLVENAFSIDLDVTGGAEYYSHLLELEGQQVKLQIWDTAGGERFRRIVQSYFRNALGVLLVFDMCERKTFAALPGWLNEIREMCAPTAAVLLIGNKADLQENRTVTREEAEQFARDHELGYIETSARSGLNVREAFLVTATQMYRKRFAPQPEPESDYVEHLEEEEGPSSVRKEAGSSVQNEVPSSAQNPVPSSVQKHGSELRLSTKGLENVSSLGVRDFVIRLADSSVGCSRFEASFLSPRITAALLEDPTVAEYEIDVETECDSSESASDCLSQLVSLSRNGSIEITSSNVGLLISVSQCLDNCELTDALFRWRIEVEPLNCSTVANRLSTASLLGISPTKEIEYLASHFFEMDPDLLRSVSHDHLAEVLESAHLQIETENSLLNSILELGPPYFSLLGFVRSEFLNSVGIDRLLDVIPLDYIDEGLWESLCRRLRLSVRLASVPVSRFHTEQYRFESSRPLEGIMHELRRTCSGNLDREDIISVSASGNSRNHCRQVFDSDWTDFWSSTDMKNSWIQIDFKGRRVCPTNYTIGIGGWSSHHLLQWSLEGSNDEERWICLDHRSTEGFSGARLVKSFACESKQSGGSFFQFIRLIQTGPNSSGLHDLALSNLELFGSVCADEVCKLSQK